MLKLVRDAAGVTEYLLPPLPNTLYTRDTTCWIYGGVHAEPALLAGAARGDDPDDLDLQVPPGLRRQGQRLVGRSDADHGLATLEGGDVMPIGKGNVLIGMSERTSRQAISQLAAALFKKGAAERVIVAAMPKLRAAMHLDTVFTFADRDCVLLYPDIVYNINAFSYRPANKPSGVELRKDEKPFVEAVAEALGLKKLRVVETGGTRTCASARSGTAAPIWSAPRRASSSPTTATPTRTPCCARKGSRSSPSSAPNWAAAAAAATA